MTDLNNQNVPLSKEASLRHDYEYRSDQQLEEEIRLQRWAEAGAYVGYIGSLKLGVDAAIAGDVMSAFLGGSVFGICVAYIKDTQLHNAIRRDVIDQRQSER